MERAVRRNRRAPTRCSSRATARLTADCVSPSDSPAARKLLAFTTEQNTSRPSSWRRSKRRGRFLIMLGVPRMRVRKALCSLKIALQESPGIEEDAMIVITAPTAKIGRQVLQRVLDAGARVRVIARNPEHLPAETARRVEIVQGSHGDARVVDAAFEGADTVFWLCPPDPCATSLEAAYLDFTRPACDA